MSGLRGAAELPEPEHEPTTAREAADEVLSGSEYDEPGASIPERINQAISDFLESVFDSLGASIGGGTAGFLAWVLLALLVAAVAGLVVWALAGGLRRGARGAREETGDAVVVLGEVRSARQWMELAEQHETASRWREGLLCRYRSLVVELSRAGLIPDAAGRTTGEYVRDLAAVVARARPPAQDAARRAHGAFTAATDLFEAVWYGGAEAGAEQRDRFAELASVTVAAAGELGSGMPAASGASGS